MKKAAKAGVVLLRIAVLVYVGLLAMLYLGQTRIIFPATRGLTATPEALGWAYEEVTLPVGKETTCARFLPVENPRATVLFSHGNAQTLSEWMLAMDVYRRLGCNVLVYDYGGYGLSTGRPSEKRCYADGRAVWRYLTQARGIPPDRIVLIGRSLGSGVAAQLAVEAKPAAVVLESAFLSLPEMAQHLYPFFPARYLVRHRFDTQSKVPRIEAPILFVHGAEDELVPLAHGKRLYELAKGPKKFLRIEGGHDSAYTESEWEYAAGLGEFLDAVLPRETEGERGAGE